ncbi:hypothetical protein EON63_11995 [archaeon]|nr:MAG: hypothetical protein EON63_11995 [archaeon]
MSDPTVELDLKYWGTSRELDNFIFLFERPDGAVLVSADYQRVYLVLGQTQRFSLFANVEFRQDEVLKKPDLPVPRMHTPVVGTVLITHLINWDGKIHYDGHILPLFLAPKKVLRLAMLAYVKAFNTKTIITQLTLIPPAVLTPPSAADLDEFAVLVADKVRLIMSKAVASEEEWTMTRSGGREESNPEHLVYIVLNASKIQVEFCYIFIICSAVFLYT